MSATGVQRRAVFLDRDGVLNAVQVHDGIPYPPGGLDEFRLLDGVAEALARLRSVGFLLIVVTNQPDVGAGVQLRSVVESMHTWLQDHLALDDIRVCWDRNLPCYKPRPGMLLAAAAEWGIDLVRSFMVGDRWRDISAGVAAGCHTILLGDGYGEELPHAPHHRARALIDCVPYILQTAVDTRHHHQ